MTRHELARAWDIDWFENDTRDERRDHAVPRDIVGWPPCTKTDRQGGLGGGGRDERDIERENENVREDPETSFLAVDYSPSYVRRSVGDIIVSHEIRVVVDLRARRFARVPESRARST